MSDDNKEVLDIKEVLNDNESLKIKEFCYHRKDMEIKGRIN